MPDIKYVHIVVAVYIYSYLPGKASPISVHPQPGISVELAKSSMNYVTLSPLSLASTGRYRCEVSEEGPTFATDSKATLYFIVQIIYFSGSSINFKLRSSYIDTLSGILVKRPLVRGFVGGGGAGAGAQDRGRKEQVSQLSSTALNTVFCRYYVGERLKVNCSSAATLPPANLTWYINQKLVSFHCLAQSL